MSKQWNYLWLSLCFLGVIPKTVLAETNVNKFLDTYTQVASSLKNDHKAVEELKFLIKKSPEDTEVIVKFWDHKARSAYQDPMFIEMQHCREKFDNERYKNISTEEKNEYKEKCADQKTEPYFIEYYYDHWEEIRTMIANKRYSYLAES